jgi:phosphoglycerate dehydrogenase-like enzyme
MTEIKVAVLDDYLHVAEAGADWSLLPDHVSVDFFHESLPTGDARADALRPYDVLMLTRERTPFPAGLLRELPKLKLICSPEMHNRVLDFEYCRANGIPVCGTAARPSPTFEITWALLLALAKNLTRDDRAMREGLWQTNVGSEIRGKVLGVVGLGRIGADVVKVGRAFGMKVIAWSENMTPEQAKTHGADLVEKDSLFREADFVVVQVILSDRTRKLIGRHELGLMKPTAFLVNPARGPIVDEAALVEVLREGRIAGAGLDVYDEEPLPADHPFRELPNTVLTPHVGGFTQEHYAHWYGGMLENLVAWLGGETIREIEGAGIVAERPA